MLSASPNSPLKASSPLRSDRRAFLTSTMAAAGTWVCSAPAVHALGANDRLRVGLIGCGNRGRHVLREAIKAGVQAVALADCAGFRIEGALDDVRQAGQPLPRTFRDYRELLTRDDVDAVIIATPDHHHHACLLAAMAARKHAYCEKPLSKTIPEGREMIQAVRKAGCVVQVGNQRHSGDHWKRCRDVIQSRDFGDLVWVKVWDTRNWVKRDPFAVPASFNAQQRESIDWPMFLGNALRRDFDPVRYWAWRWYWDYAGGLMTDIGAHQLDVVQWLSGVDAPKSVVAHGGVYHFKHWETPDVIHGVWDYGSFCATFAVQFINGTEGVGAAFYGTKMTLMADASAGGEIRVFDTIDRLKPDVTKPRMAWKVENETPAHVKNWVDSCKAGTDPNSTVELGHQVITAAHLANMSYRTGKRIVWDARREAVVEG